MGKVDLNTRDEVQAVLEEDEWLESNCGVGGFSNDWYMPHLLSDVEEHLNRRMLKGWGKAREARYQELWFGTCPCKFHDGASADVNTPLLPRSIFRFVPDFSPNARLPCRNYFSILMREIGAYFLFIHNEGGSVGH